MDCGLLLEFREIQLNRKWKMHLYVLVISLKVAPSIKSNHNKLLMMMTKIMVAIQPLSRMEPLVEQRIVLALDAEFSTVQGLFPNQVLRFLKT